VFSLLIRRVDRLDRPVMLASGASRSRDAGKAGSFRSIDAPPVLGQLRAPCQPHGAGSGRYDAVHDRSHDAERPGPGPATSATPPSTRRLRPGSRFSAAFVVTAPAAHPAGRSCHPTREGPGSSRRVRSRRDTRTTRVIGPPSRRRLVGGVCGRTRPVVGGPLGRRRCFP
jgi:hypothetical protein